jgi:hypothetical protein
MLDSVAALAQQWPGCGSLPATRLPAPRLKTPGCGCGRVSGEALEPGGPLERAAPGRAAQPATQPAQ